jgi:membrane-associated phospholipid phosphatase
MTDVQHSIRPGKGTSLEDSAARRNGAGTPTVRRRRPRRFVVVAVLAVLAIVLGAVGPWAYNTLIGSSPKDRIAADPPPALFPDATVSSLGTRIDAQSASAHRLMAGWWATNGTRHDDKGFTTWLEQTLPGPPAAAARATELKGVQKLAPTRTAAGISAATWLETFGKKDVWKLYAHDQAEVVASKAGDARKSDLKDMLSMSKTVADTLGTRYQQSAPYVLDPSLRTDHTVTKGQVCPCSYPSRHAAAAAASRTYLSRFAPHMDAQYRWMQDEIDYSRVYMAGHVPSDITGGTLLGDMIGEYYLVTRGHQQVR